MVCYGSNCRNCPFIYNDDFCIINEEYMEFVSLQYKVGEEDERTRISKIFKET